MQHHWLFKQGSWPLLLLPGALPPPGNQELSTESLMQRDLPGCHNSSKGAQEASKHGQEF
eukprot:scaffold131731_cov16-Tisochrysis_lutea.AAC.1